MKILQRSVVAGLALALLGYLVAHVGLARAQSSDGKTYDSIKSNGVLIVGIGQEAAPFGYLENGQLVGFDVDIARAVGQRMEEYMGKKITLQFVPVTDETRISWVQSGRVNMSLCHTNITRKRLANIDFSVPYGWDGKALLYRASDGKRDLADFAGKTVGIKRSSSSEGEIKTYFASKGWQLPNLVQFDNHTAGIQALIDGQIDGFTDDNSIVVNTATLAGYKVGEAGVLSLTDTLYSPTYFGIGVPKDDSLWRITVDYSLHDLWLSGEFQKIYDKWFGPASTCPIPLKNHGMEAYVKG
jgi:polar amino acid transport system substrate-binding protein